MIFTREKSAVVFSQAQAIFFVYSRIHNVDHECTSVQTIWAYKIENTVYKTIY